LGRFIGLQCSGKLFKAIWNLDSTLMPIAEKVSDSGFTLLELLVVMAIIGLLSGLAAVVMPQRLSGAQAMRLQGELIVWLKEQQQRSVGRNQPVTVTATQGYLQAGEDLWQAPSNSTVQISTAALIFYPDGSASDSDIVVQSGDSDIRVTIHGLTGHVEAAR
jgi:prepilin-type N-terminal cleavage/methylation domain-containing protein